MNQHYANPIKLEPSGERLICSSQYQAGSETEDFEKREVARAILILFRTPSVLMVQSKYLAFQKDPALRVTLTTQDNFHRMGQVSQTIMTATRLSLAKLFFMSLETISRGRSYDGFVALLTRTL